jgi:hypothetical protein
VKYTGRIVAITIAIIIVILVISIDYLNYGEIDFVDVIIGLMIVYGNLKM